MAPTSLRQKPVRIRPSRRRIAVFCTFAAAAAALTAAGAGFPEMPEAILDAGPFAWPTGSRALLADLSSYHTTYPENPRIGLPGYTRNCGHRFHEGIDIAPAMAVETGRSLRMSVIDCETGESRHRTFPVMEPIDGVYAVCDGRVALALSSPAASNYGRYIVLEHEAPDGTRFVTLYAHLATTEVAVGDRVQAGDRIAAMGRSSNTATMREWLEVLPHVHFEIGRVIDRTPPKGRGPVGGIYNGRNLEGYDPLEFLERALCGAIGS